MIKLEIKCRNGTTLKRKFNNVKEAEKWLKKEIKEAEKEEKVRQKYKKSHKRLVTYP